MKLHFSVILFAAAAVLRAANPAPSSDKPSYLNKIFDLNWAADRETLVKQLESRPKMKRGDDYHGNPLFSGGELLGEPAAWWGLTMFGDRLIRADAKLQAPGDVNRFYEDWLKRLIKIIGVSPEVKRERDRNISTWRTTTGGPAGKGEIIVLQTIPKEHFIQVLVHDGNFSKPK
jgi:hypothetical protein